MISNLDVAIGLGLFTLFVIGMWLILRKYI